MQRQAAIAREEICMNKPRVAMIQMHVEEDKLKNIANASEFVKKAVEQGVDIATLPEMFCCPYKTSNFPIYAEEEGGECYRLLSKLAKTYEIYLIAGTMPEKDIEGRVFNTSYVFDRRGQ
jgi:predicted amidohydrolase